ncbi:hypothetical protein ACN28S_38810 [Cystobacter fuscus]
MRTSSLAPGCAMRGGASGSTSRTRSGRASPTLNERRASFVSWGWGETSSSRRPPLEWHGPSSAISRVPWRCCGTYWTSPGRPVSPSPSATSRCTALIQAWGPEETHREAARVLALDGLKAHAAPNPITMGVAHTALAKVALARGMPQEAEAWARGASGLLSSCLTYRLLAHIILSESLLTRGELARAREEAEQCVSGWEWLESGGFAAIRKFRVLAEVCFAQGDVEAGESALKRALRCLRTSAEDLPNPTFRARFLSQVPENARVLELARLRWGEDWSQGWVSLA